MANVSSSNGLEKYPKLRFKGFLEPWKTDTLGNLGTFMKGAPLSKADITDEGTPFVLYGELYTTYGEVTRSIKRRTDKIVEPQFYSKVGDVIMPTSGETPEDIATASCIMLPDVILAGDLLIYRTQKVDGRLVSFVVKNKVNKQISSVAQGKSVVHIRAEELSKISISYPSDAEQQKILAMLELLEDKITKQRELIEHLKKYKRGVISKILSRSFAFTHDTTIDWVSHKVGDFCSVQMCKRIFKEQTSPEGDVPFYKIGTIGGEPDAYISREVYEEYRRKYNFPRKGEFLISCAGTVGKCVVYNGEESYYQDSNIVWLRNESDFVLNEYLYILVSNVDWSTLNSTTITRIYNDNLRDLVFDFPPIEEQKKISEFYTALDKRIEVEDSNLSHLLTLKQGLIQGLFA